MNARGETIARLMLALLAGRVGHQAIEEGATAWHFLAVFGLGYWFAAAPEISRWIESRGNNAQDQQR